MRLLIVDDHLCFAEALAQHLRSSYQVAGALHKPEDVLPWMATHRVDLVLLDGTLPRCDIFALIRRIEKQATVVVVSMYADPSTWPGLRRMGAMGVVSKSSSLDEFTRELARIAKLNRGDQDGDRSTRTREPTSRQLEVISAMARGDSAKQIAQAIGLSVPRTNEIIGQIHRALACRTSAEIAMYAVEHGWIEPRVPPPPPDSTACTSPQHESANQDRREHIDFAVLRPYR